MPKASAKCSVTEREFNAVAAAAYLFLERGDSASAFELDDLARKINRALCTADRQRRGTSFTRILDVDIESPLESAGLRKRAARKDSGRPLLTV